MPNRIVRHGILSSKHLGGLSASARWTFLGIILQADDFGRLEADPVVLRAQIWPRDLETHVKPDEFNRWLCDIAQSGLVLRYEVDGKPYMHVHRFKNKPRASESRFPPPPPAIPEHTQRMDACATDVPLTGTGTGTGTGTSTVTPPTPQGGMDGETKDQKDTEQTEPFSGRPMPESWGQDAVVHSAVMDSQPTPPPPDVPEPEPEPEKRKIDDALAAYFKARGQRVHHGTRRKAMELAFDRGGGHGVDRVVEAIKKLQTDKRPPADLGFAVNAAAKAKDKDDDAANATRVRSKPGKYANVGTKVQTSRNA